MLLLSIDVGIRNLAMVLMNMESKTIIEWCCDGVPPESDDGLFLSLKKHLDTKPWTLQADLVLIEKQPDKNKKMKSVEHFIHTYFLCNNLQVRLWDARHKIPDVVGPGKRQYAKRKKASIDRCREFIKGSSHQAFFESHAKKDDLADCVMQALSYTDVKPVEVKPKKKTPRMPTDNQSETKYSKANLAWLYKHGKHNTARFVKDLKRYYSDINQLIKDFQL
jgi:hypothetical protein